MTRCRSIAIGVLVGAKLGAGLVGMLWAADHHRLSIGGGRIPSEARCMDPANPESRPLRTDEARELADECLQLAAHECIVARQDSKGFEIGRRLR